MLVGICCLLVAHQIDCNQYLVLAISLSDTNSTSVHLNPLHLIEDAATVTAIPVKPNQGNDVAGRIIPHPKDRKDRFPSVDARIRLYMSNWFQAPCSDTTRLNYVMEVDKDAFPILRYTGDVDGTEQTVYSSVVRADTKILLENETMSDCGRPRVVGDPGWDKLEKFPRTESRIKQRGNMWNYCRDSIEILNITRTLNAKGSLPDSPLILQFGDLETLSRSIPVFAKFRGRISKTELQRVTNASTCADRPYATTMSITNPGYAPIIWNLNSVRHFGWFERARNQDIPWHEKKLGALWRGFMTGFMDISKNATELDQCLSNPRCRFVYETKLRNSSLIDAALIGVYSHYKGGTSCNGVPLRVSQQATLEEIQSYKVIVSLEGNDVSSALKWNLMSNSVVVMPPPTKTSWAMEELLEPWVHYIPVHANLSNLEEMIRWVGANDKHAQQIAERATLFIFDLWMSPEAKIDNEAVKYGIVDRYRKLWRLKGQSLL